MADLGTAAAQIVHQYGSGGDAVHIIVAENGDVLALLHSLPDAPDGPIHVLHQEGGEGEGVVDLQESPGSGIVGNAVGGQHRRQQSRVAGLLQLRDRRGGGGKIPLFKFHARLTSL